MTTTCLFDEKATAQQCENCEKFICEEHQNPTIVSLVPLKKNGTVDYKKIFGMKEKTEILCPDCLDEFNIKKQVAIDETKKTVTKQNESVARLNKIMITVMAILISFVGFTLYRFFSL